MGRKSKEQLAAEAALAAAKTINQEYDKEENATPQEFEPPKFFERNELGLVKGLKYHFDELNLVNWRKMIPAKYLYIPQDKVEKAEKFYKKPVSELNLEEVEDRFLAVLLGGLRYLCQIRGVQSVKTRIEHVTHDPYNYFTTGCSHTCEITFIGNYETNFQPLTFSDSAGASYKTASKFMQPYIECLSANRAFCRAVRAGLGINIVSKDEMVELNGSELVTEQTKPSGHDPLESLKARCKSNQGTEITFDILKHTCSTKYKDKMVSDPQEWKVWEDIHKNDIFTILHLLNSK